MTVYEGAEGQPVEPAVSDTPESVAPVTTPEDLGETLVGVEHGAFDEVWRPILEGVKDFTPLEHNIAFDGQRRDGSRLHRVLKVIHAVDENGKVNKKVVITEATAAALTAFGIRIILNGNFSAIPRPPRWQRPAKK